MSLLVLTVLSIAVIVACMTPSGAAQPAYAERVIRGWKIGSLTANKWNGAVLIGDYAGASSWVRTARPSNAALIPLPTPSFIPDPSLAAFNASYLGVIMTKVLAADPGRAWVYVSSDGSLGHCLYYVDVGTASILANVSQLRFATDDIEVAIAVDAHSALWVLAGPTAWSGVWGWSFGTDGRQLSQFNLTGARAGAVVLDFEIDAAGSLWILDDVATDHLRHQDTRLSRYSNTGKAMGFSPINFTEALQAGYDLSFDIDSARTAYFAADTIPYIVTYDTKTQKRGPNIPTQLPHQPRSHLDLSLLNDSVLLVVDLDSHDAVIEAIDITSRQPAFYIHSPQAILWKPISIQASGDYLLALSEEMDGANHSGIIAIHPRHGTFAFEFQTPPDDAKFNLVSYGGFAVDSKGVVYVESSRYITDRSVQQMIQQFGPQGDYRSYVNVTLLGPVGMDEEQNLLWVSGIIGGGQRTICAFSTKYGQLVQMIDLESTLGFVPDVTGLQHTVNASGAGLLVLVSRSDNGSIIAIITEDGQLQAPLTPLPFHPTSLRVNATNGRMYVTGQGSEQWGMDRNSSVLEYDGGGKLVRVLKPPMGWELTAFIDVTVDAAGTVYALDSYYSAIFVFPAPHATSSSSPSSVSWLSSSSSTAVGLSAESSLPSSVTAGAVESSINTPVLIVAIFMTAVALVVLVWVVGLYVLRRKRAQISSPERGGYVRSWE